MPIGFIRPWKGVDVSNPEVRAANWFKTRIQSFRNDWLNFRLKHGIMLGTAKLASPVIRGDFSDAEKADYAVRRLLHCLSQDMKTPENRVRAIETLGRVNDETKGLGELGDLAALLDQPFRECRAIELQQVRQNIEFLCNGLPDDAADRIWMTEIHRQLDQFLMVEKRYGHSELLSNPGRSTVIAGTIHPNMADEPVVVDGPRDTVLKPTETRMQNPSLPNDPFEESRVSESASPFAIFVNPEVSRTDPTPQESDSDTSFSEELLKTGKAPSPPPVAWTVDEPDEADSSSEESAEDRSDGRSPGATAVATPSTPPAPGNGSVRPVQPLEEAPAAPAGKQPAKAVPTGAIWTAEMTAQQRRTRSATLIADLLTYAERLETVSMQNRKLWLKACFETLNWLADPGLDPYRSDSLRAALKNRIPNLLFLNQAMERLREVRDIVPSEKRTRTLAILEEWGALVEASETKLALHVTPLRPMDTPMVTTAVVEANFRGA